jgi:hypothetical protein
VDDVTRGRGFWGGVGVGRGLGVMSVHVEWLTGRFATPCFLLQDS